MERTVNTPEELRSAIERVRTGETYMYVPTYTRTTVIDRMALRRWDKAGLAVLWHDANGDLRMASGTKSVCLLRDQLRERSVISEEGEACA